MYVSPNLKTKKALREHVEAGAKIEVFQPGHMFSHSLNGTLFVEGPHYPRLHRWYATVKVEHGLVVKVIK